jgi:hypothetical protein
MRDYHLSLLAPNLLLFASWRRPRCGQVRCQVPDRSAAARRCRRQSGAEQAIVHSGHCPRRPCPVPGTGHGPCGQAAKVAERWCATRGSSSTGRRVSHLDQIARTLEWTPLARLEAGGKLLQDHVVEMAGKPRAGRVPLEDDLRRWAAEDLHEAACRQRPQLGGVRKARFDHERHPSLQRPTRDDVPHLVGHRAQTP